MITGLHTMFYCSEAEELRAFLRDKLGFKGTDVGGGWLIFKMPPAEMGVHPTDYPEAPPSGNADLSFICDEIQGTVTDLKSKGVAFLDDVTDAGFGWITHFSAPGGIKIMLYQPKYSA